MALARVKTFVYAVVICLARAAGGLGTTLAVARRLKPSVLPTRWILPVHPRDCTVTTMFAPLPRLRRQHLQYARRTWWAMMALARVKTFVYAVVICLARAAGGLGTTLAVARRLKPSVLPT